MKTGRFIDAEGIRAEVTQIRAADGVAGASVEIKITGEGRLTPQAWIEFSERITKAAEEMEGLRR